MGWKCVIKNKMHLPRVISRIDIKGAKLIKGKSFEGVKVLGDACDATKHAESSGFDEIFVLDSVASLYDRSPAIDYLREIVADLSIPVCVGGGIKNYEQAAQLFELGIEKICINTNSFKNKNLITQIANAFGSQAIVCSVQAMNVAGNYFASYFCGRDNSGIPLLSWISECIDRGSGEVFLTSVSHDGHMSGPDMNLVDQFNNHKFSVPLVYSGGVVTPDQVKVLFSKGFHGVAIGHAFHLGKFSPSMSQRNILKSDKAS